MFWIYYNLTSEKQLANSTLYILPCHFSIDRQRDLICFFRLAVAADIVLSRQAPFPHWMLGRHAVGSFVT